MNLTNNVPDSPVEPILDLNGLVPPHFPNTVQAFNNLKGFRFLYNGFLFQTNDLFEHGQLTKLMVCLLVTGSHLQL